MTTTLASHSPLADLLPAVRAFLNRTPTLLIGGRWIPAASGETFPTRNPADGSALAHIASGDKKDVHRAARAARDISKAHILAGKLNAGTVWVNTYGGGDPGVPFGGYKQSGWGRERGHEVLELYTQTKSVVVKL